MVYVRMLMQRTGGRFDGQEWCGYLEIMDVPQWEADDLIREGQAEYPDQALMDRGFDVLKEADVNYESHLRPVDYVEDNDDPRYVRKTHLVPVEENDDDYDSDFERDDYDNDFERDEPEPVKRPYTNATKDQWVKYAVSLGADGREAREMTKAALIDKFGS